MSENKVYAPKIDPNVLWKMSANNFNEWREKNDYPRIIDFFKRRLPDFETWLSEYKISDDTLIKHSPSTFLANQKMLYLYKILHDGKEETEMVLEQCYEVNNTFFHENLVKERNDIVPYPAWYFQKYNKNSPEISVSMIQGRSCYLLSELEFFDLGHTGIYEDFGIGNRRVDFTNVSDLRIVNCLTNSKLKLWFCAATNLTIEGDLAFVDAYKTKFYEVYSRKNTNLKLINGNFQSWVLTNCEVNVDITNAVIHLWRFTGWDFTATLNNSDIKDCEFANSAINNPIGLGRARDFHSHVKRLYSQIGKRKEASKHFYLEKTFERRAFLHVKENFRNEHFRAKKWYDKFILKVKYLCKYIYSGLLNILWGYGERPARVFGISIVSILTFALIYCFWPGASENTHHNFWNSLYYSMVTFTTLGYGDIYQKTGFLKILSGTEALLGMSFWGILIAGFTNNSRDY